MRFVLEPNLYGLDVERAFARDFIQARGEVFLKSSIALAARISKHHRGKLQTEIEDMDLPNPVIRSHSRKSRVSAKTGREQSQQIASYSITSSARASMAGGISKPSAFAVLRLITNSYLVGVCTGRSAGFSPLRMRST